jgi:hypothetical protein
MLQRNDIPDGEPLHATYETEHARLMAKAKPRYRIKSFHHPLRGCTICFRATVWRRCSTAAGLRKRSFREPEVVGQVLNQAFIFAFILLGLVALCVLLLDAGASF